MSDSFSDRKNAFESKYQLDQEQTFKIQARANKRLGLWAAGKLGLEGDKAAAYALEVVSADFEEAGTDDVVRKVKGDLDAKGLTVEAVEIKKQLHQFETEARKEVVGE
ncbi:MAG: DUF1476 domain-containing protein [Acetobacterales bacterium]